jgi:hypothetical protein
VAWLGRKSKLTWREEWVDLILIVWDLWYASSPVPRRPGTITRAMVPTLFSVWARLGPRSRVWATATAFLTPVMRAWTWIRTAVSTIASSGWLVPSYSQVLTRSVITWTVPFADLYSTIFTEYLFGVEFLDSGEGVLLVDILHKTITPGDFGRVIKPRLVNNSRESQGPIHLESAFEVLISDTIRKPPNI